MKSTVRKTFNLGFMIDKSVINRIKLSLESQSNRSQQLE